jgi:YkoY family integral membrane protein
MLFATWFGQEFEIHDIAVVALLVVLEGVLSIDNALVLGLLAKRLPKHQQGRALTYGLVGAFLFRLLAIATATFLLRWRIVKLLGGAYLVYVAVKYFFFESRVQSDEKITVGPDGTPIILDDGTGKPPNLETVEDEIQARTPLHVPELEQEPGKAAKFARFWPTVLVIELTDIAFAIDSILAAIALVGPAPSGHAGPHPKLWVVLTGGMLGVILMRFAAIIFIKLLERFPRFETSAYLLVLVIGGKLMADYTLNTPDHPHRLDFHDFRHPAFWTFWLLMLVCFLLGFVPKRQRPSQPPAAKT